MAKAVELSSSEIKRLMKCRHLKVPREKILTTPADSALQREAFNREFANHLLYLKARWQDEAEYENPNDYRDSIAKRFPKGIEMVSFSTEPFGFLYTLNRNGAVYRCRVNDSSIAYARVK